MGNDAEGYRVSVRWTALGTHRGYALYGEPTGRRVHLWGINQLYIVRRPDHRGMVAVQRVRRAGAAAGRRSARRCSHDAAEPAGDVITVSCAQLAPVVGDLAGNLERSVAAVAAAAGRRCDRAAGAGDQRVRLRQRRAGCGVARSPATTRCSTRGRRPARVRWSWAVSPSGTRTVCCATAPYCSTATGARVVYRKTHLWDAEALYFIPGDDPPPVVDTAAGRIGVVDLLRPGVPGAHPVAGAARSAVAGRADELAAGRTSGRRAPARAHHRDGSGAGEPDGDRVCGPHARRAAACCTPRAPRSSTRTGGW